MERGGEGACFDYSDPHTSVQFLLNVVHVVVAVFDQ